MKKALVLLPLAALLVGTAHAGTYSVVQESECPLVTAGELSKAIQSAGLATGLNLSKDMTLRAELRCARDGKTAAGARYVYTFRAAIEKQLADGEAMRWAPVAHLTGFGTAAASAPLLRQVQFTVRDLIRQEP